MSYRKYNLKVGLLFKRQTYLSTVSVFSTSISKKEEALSLLGADKFVVSSNQEEMTVRIT